MMTPIDETDTWVKKPVADIMYLSREQTVKYQIPILFFGPPCTLSQRRHQRSIVGQGTDRCAGAPVVLMILMQSAGLWGWDWPMLGRLAVKWRHLSSDRRPSQIHPCRLHRNQMPRVIDLSRRLATRYPSSVRDARLDLRSPRQFCAAVTAAAAAAAAETNALCRQPVAYNGNVTLGRFLPNVTQSPTIACSTRFNNTSLYSVVWHSFRHCLLHFNQLHVP